MTNTSTNVKDDPGPIPAPGVVATTVRKTVSTPLQFVGFWAAVALPFLYLPLVYGGLQGSEATVFVGLLALNLAGLVLGRSYQRE